MLTPEMKFLEETIINSLGVPLEFIKGGSTFTSGSVSLRIVENHFITYRELLQDFVNHFMVNKLRDLLMYPEVEVKFKSFKMADDAQSKQLAINLNQMGKISDSRLLGEFGYNHEEEKAAITSDQIDNLEAQVENSKKSATAQGEAQLVATKYQIRAEQVAADERARLQIEMFEDELSAENVGVPQDHHKIIERYAQQIYNMPPENQQITFQKMQQSMPVTFGFVNRKVQEMWQQDEIQRQQQEAAAAEAAAQQVEQKEAPNQKKIGERKQDQVKIQGEKKKAPTKGSV